MPTTCRGISTGARVRRQTARGRRDWQITSVPSFRVDVSREADLIEEVGRHFGFDRLPVRFPALVEPQAPPDARIARDRLVRLALTSAGFSESMTFAFIERQAALPFCEPGVEPVAIANPLSEKFAVLRPSLLAGLTDSCVHNRRRGRKDVRLFETGSRFTSAGEGRSAGLVWCGAASGPHWSSPVRPVDFFDVKGAVELLCAAFGVHAPEFVASVCPFLVRGRAADVRAGGRHLGVAGQLLPAIAEARGFPAGEDIYVAEIDTEAIARRVGRRRSPRRVAAAVSRRSCATSRSSSTKPCLPPPFVALSDRRRRTRSHRSWNSIGTRARACRTAASASRCG